MDNKILVCGPSWIGDMVMSHSLIQILKSRFPDSQIDVLAPAWSRAVARFIPEVTTIFTLPFEHGELALKQRMYFGQTLSRLQYQQCYILPNSFKSALVPWFARIPVRIGWKAECRSVLLTDARTPDATLARMHHRYAALGVPADEWSHTVVPAPQLHHDTSEMRSLANKLEFSDSDSIIALAPGAEYGSSKQWPRQNFVTLASKLRLAGHRVVLLGSQSDQQLCQQIASQAQSEKGGVISLAGKLSLDQAMHFLPLCRALVCHDSGLMHIAAALQVPLVALFGSTNPTHTPPLSTVAQVIYKKLDCSPCFKRECPLQHHNCMNDIQPTEVIEAVTGLLTPIGE